MKPMWLCIKHSDWGYVNITSIVNIYFYNNFASTAKISKSQVIFFLCTCAGDSSRVYFHLKSQLLFLYSHVTVQIILLIVKHNSFLKPRAIKITNTTHFNYQKIVLIDV